MENHIFFSIFLPHFLIYISDWNNLQILELIEAIDQNDKNKIRDMMMKVIYWVLMVGCMFKQMVGIPNSKKYEMYLKMVKRFWREKSGIWQSWGTVCINWISIHS